MREFGQIIAAFDELISEGKPAALATVVAIGGSSYRRPGARMLVAADGRIWGGISGGCLERDVARRARSVIEQVEPVLCRYDTTESPGDLESDLLLDLGRTPGVALGCRGAIDLFIERVSAHSPGPIPLIVKGVRQRVSTRYATLIRKSAQVQAPLGTRFFIDEDANSRHPSIDPELACTASAAIHGDSDSKYGSVQRVCLREHQSADLYVETLRPPQSIVVFGGGSDVVPVTELAKALGWHVTIVAGAGSIGARERFATADVLCITDMSDPVDGVVPEPHAAVVLMTHDFPQDAKILRSLAGRSICYLGILGPRSRTERLLAQTDSASLWNIFSPAGLDLGADNPELIALAIISEIQAVLAGRPGGLLRDRPGPIYPRGGIET